MTGLRHQNPTGECCRRLRHDWPNAYGSLGKLHMKGAQWKDFSRIVAAYLIALIAALWTFEFTDSYSPLWQAAIADVVATAVIFVFSRIYDNSSFYDAYWSVAPPLLFCFWLVSYEIFDARTAILALLVNLWAVRLTYNWAVGWQGLSHQDWRYVDLQAKAGRWYPALDFFGIQLMPTVWVFLGCVPLWLICASEPLPLYWLDGIWVVVGFSALLLETRADQILRRFRHHPERRGEVLREDVWGWCRHPNYLGELGFWFALGIAGFAVSGSWLSGLGSAVMVLLFVGVSIPMIDKRQLANKPAYAIYQAEVPSLVPSLRRVPRD